MILKEIFKYFRLSSIILQNYRKNIFSFKLCICLISIILFVAIVSLFFLGQNIHQAQATQNMSMTTRPAQPSGFSTSNIDNNFSMYQSTDFGIRLEYPSNWTITHSCCKGQYGTVTFTSPEENGNVVNFEYSSPPENISGVSLMEKINKNINNMSNQSDITSFQLIESKPISEANNSSWKIEYTYNPLEYYSSPSPMSGELGPPYQKEGSPIFRVMESWLVLDDKLYALRYFSEQKNERLYFMYMPIAQKMIHSFVSESLLEEQLKQVIQQISEVRKYTWTRDNAYSYEPVKRWENLALNTTEKAFGMNSEEFQDLSAIIVDESWKNENRPDAVPPEVFINSYFQDRMNSLERMLSEFLQRLKY
jgi:hypothetical protein